MGFSGFLRGVGGILAGVGLFEELLCGVMVA
jgi:hypothetical protein